MWLSNKLSSLSLILACISVAAFAIGILMIVACIIMWIWVMAGVVLLFKIALTIVIISFVCGCIFGTICAM